MAALMEPRPRVRRYMGDGTRGVDPEENVRLQELRDAVQPSKDPTMVVLFSPLYEALRYGPGVGSAPGAHEDQLVFGPAPNVLVVPRDHPLLPGLLKAHPEIEVVTGPTQRDTGERFLDPIGGQEFGSAEALAEHLRATYSMSPRKKPRES